MILRLTQYHMDVVYKSGKSMLVSDCLSRMANPATCKEDESLNLQITSIEQEQCITLSEVKKALTEDPVSILLGDLIVNGWPDSCKDLENELKPYWIHRFNFSLVDGAILLGKDCIVVPVTLCEKFLYALHYTHQGITKLWVELRIMHIGQELPMMFLNCAESVKYVPKIMQIHLYQHPLIVKHLDLDSSMVWTLGKLMVFLT